MLAYLVLGSVLALAPPASQPEDDLSRGDSLVARGEYQAARDVYQAAVEKDATVPALWRLLLVLVELEQWDDATSTADALLIKDPSLAEDPDVVRLIGAIGRRGSLMPDGLPINASADQITARLIRDVSRSSTRTELYESHSRLRARTSLTLGAPLPSETDWRALGILALLEQDADLAAIASAGLALNRVSGEDRLRQDLSELCTAEDVDEATERELQLQEVMLACLVDESMRCQPIIAQLIGGVRGIACHFGAARWIELAIDRGAVYGGDLQPLSWTDMFDQVLTYIPAGRFMMGSPANEAGRESDERPFEARLTAGYWIGRTEVNQAVWTALMPENPSGVFGASLPANRISWRGAEELCARMSSLAGLRYRLPTEAEWERACRAGSTQPYSSGSELSIQHAHFGRSGAGSAGGLFDDVLVPTGALEPNSWGLHDMHGNVAEWTSDWSGPYPKVATADPTGPETGVRRIHRGGSWSTAAVDCRCSARMRRTRLASRDLGVRVVLEQPTYQ